MGDSESETSTTLKLPRFYGKRNEDYGLWRMRLRAACRVKGVWRAVESGSSSETAEQNSESLEQPSTSDQQASSSMKCDVEKSEKASAIIISALGDAPLRVVMEAEDDPARMMKLLDARYASSRTVSRIAVQTQLFRMNYTGQNMSTYIDQFTSLFSQLERMGKDAAIPESHKAPMLLASIDPNCTLESTAAALRTKEASELTWDYVATTLIDEYNARLVSSDTINTSSAKSKKKKRKSKITSSMSASTQQDDHDDSTDSEIEKTVQAFSAALKSSMSHKTSDTSKCEFCGRKGHTEDRCFLNPENPNNKLTPKMKAAMASKEKKGSTNDNNSKDSAKNNKHKVELAGSVVEKMTIDPPKDFRTYADSGATIHCFFNREAFVPGTLTSCSERTVEFADKTSANANLWGQVLISFDHVNIRLHNVLYVPSMAYNLVSTGRLADNGIESLFRRHDVLLQLESNNTVIGHGIRDLDSKLYVFSNEIAMNVLKVSDVTNSSDTTLWHQRLAHINMQDLSLVHKHVDGVPKLTASSDSCRACSLGKAHKLPFHSHFKQTSSVGELVHSDIMGKLEMSYPNRYRYVCTFTDDFSRYTYLGFLHRKSDLLAAFEQIQDKFSKIILGKVNFYGSSIIQKLHSDGAKEYKALENYFGGSGLNKSFSPPYTPEHNAIAERINRTLCDAARALLIQANLPVCLWPFALKHVIYVRNRVQHSTTVTTPLFLMTGERPNLKYLRVFGCTAFVLRLPQPTKFENRAIEGVYLESKEHGIYKVLINQDRRYRFIESRHVTFNEREFLGAPGLEESMGEEASDDDTTSWNSASQSCSSEELPFHDVSSPETDFESEDSDADIQERPIKLEPEEENNDFNENESQTIDDEDDDDHTNDADDDQSNDGSNDRNNEEHENLDRRYPTRERRPPGQWYVASAALSNDNFKVTTSDDPTLSEIKSATPEERLQWDASIAEEFKAFEELETWELDDHPKSQPLPTHMVFKVKRKSNGNVERLRSRTVAGGNHQVFGENYLETYAPVVSFTLVRIFLYIALLLNMFKAQLDVKTAFLNGLLSEAIWVMSPKGIEGYPSRCYRLKRAIYGLKQAHLAWHKRLCDDLLNLGFEELQSAPCVFRLKDCQFGGDVFLLVYVDDILVLSTTQEGIKYVTESFKILYTVRVTFDVEWFLGVKINWLRGEDGTPNQLMLSQTMYIDGLLRRFGMDKAKPVSTPMVTAFWNSKSAESDKSIISVKVYEQMIGSLLYLALRSRPDILAAVLILARFQKSPTAYCHQAVKRVFRYLQGSRNLCMIYETGDMKINSFVDSDYASDTVDRKSMSGFVVKLGNATCIWASKKQPTVTLSTCEAEYHAMTMAAKEVIWLRRIMGEAGFENHYCVPMSSDNQSAINWVEAEQCHPVRAKHVDIQLHFIRDLWKEKNLSFPYVPSAENDADIFTKPLEISLHKANCRRIGLTTADEEEC